MKTFKKALLIISILIMAGCASKSSHLPEQAIFTPSKTSPVILPKNNNATLPILSTSTVNNSRSTSTSLPPKDPVVTQSTPLILPTLSSFDPDAWMKLPVIPQISQRVMEIYQTGIALGNDPHRFSKVGDCGSTPTWFLGDFDRGDRFYSLGEYTNLQKIIQYYSGSFSRTSLAAQSGFNASSVLTPLWADHTLCLSNETPLACEYRMHKPILAFITLGTNDVFHQESFEPQMRKIIEYSIDHGVIPVLSTKADNIEKNHFINKTICKLAMEYQVPLWNYWLAVQSLPNQGLQEDGAHISWAANHFDDAETMQKGWPVRNLTALQVLEAIWININSQSN